MKRVFFTILFFSSILRAVEVGEVLKPTVLDDKDGGRVDGGAWSSESLKGKVHVIFYVDPDKKDLNEDFADRLKSENFDHSKFGSVAIANLAATWKPDIIIEAILKHKQKKFPQALYLKDKRKFFVKSWGMRDDDYDILITDKHNKVIFKKEGRLTKDEIEQAINLIKSKI